MKSSRNNDSTVYQYKSELLRVINPYRRKSLYREATESLVSLPRQVLFAYLYYFVLFFLASIISSIRPFLMLGIFFGVLLVIWDEVNRLDYLSQRRSVKSKSALFVEVVDMEASNILDLLHRQLEGLTNEDIAWLSEVGSSRQVLPNEILIHEKQPVSSLFIILSGKFEVSTTSVQKLPLGNLATNRVHLSIVDSKVIGEMSFVEGEDYLPSATVKAVSESWVWSISKAMLSERISREPDFGMRFYKVLCSILSNRLRSANELRTENEGKPVKERSRFNLFHGRNSNSYPFVELTPGMVLFMIDSFA